MKEDLLCEHMNWPVYCFVGGHRRAFNQDSSFTAGVGLRRHKRHLRSLSYVRRRFQATIYVNSVPRDLNPVDGLVTYRL